jgi:release factor glutamine methyltransferase
LLDVLQAAAAYLERHGVEQPRLTAELLGSHVLGCKRLELYLRFDARLSDPQLQALRVGVRRLAAGEPLQYVTGATDFMGHLLRLNPAVLIPRPETERLVELVLAHAPLWSREKPRIVDVGTGSGCIAIALALARPQAEYWALDISYEAVATAQANAATLGAGGLIRLAVSDLLAALPSGALDAVAANLPYIAGDDYARLPRHIREREPRLALDGGHDGLECIRRLIPQARIALRPGGALFLEIGYNQGPAVRELLAGFDGVRIETDIAGHDRVAWGIRAS